MKCTEEAQAQKIAGTELRVNHRNVEHRMWTEPFPVSLDERPVYFRFTMKSHGTIKKQ